MRAHYIFLLAGIALSACNSTSSNTSFVGPSGEQIHSTKCSSHRRRTIIPKRVGFPVGCDTLEVYPDAVNSAASFGGLVSLVPSSIASVPETRHLNGLAGSVPTHSI